MIILGGGLVKHHIANANLMVRGVGAPPVSWAMGCGAPLRMGRGRRSSPCSSPRRGTGPISPSTSTRRRSLMAPTRGHGQMKLCPGARSGWMPPLSRWDGGGPGVGCGIWGAWRALPHSHPLFSAQVYADASLVFPLLVAETFAQRADAFPSEMPAD